MKPLSQHGAHGPPQSTSSSPWFRTPSLHVGARHTFGMASTWSQMPLPSISTSWLPQPQMPGATLLASAAHPSSGAHTWSPSASLSASRGHGSHAFPRPSPSSSCWFSFAVSGQLSTLSGQRSPSASPLAPPSSSSGTTRRRLYGKSSIGGSSLGGPVPLPSFSSPRSPSASPSHSTVGGSYTMPSGLSHTPESQSLPSPHVSSGTHRRQMGPPQSTSLSPPFWMPSVHDESAQTPKKVPCPSTVSGTTASFTQLWLSH
mmetsp:Transcript_3078/g.11034  ORF Transcript_3078/g.11034 Transcript_3078/m.11034 type:complete len:259 (-) Transcript_3078:1275-2051(-)